MPLSPKEVFESESKQHILFAPLDWGLGHATRCIPLVKKALDNGHKVTIAADRAPLELLKLEFPELPFIKLRGYEITYPKSGNMTMAMAIQLPKIIRRILIENIEIKRIVKGLKIDLVISDNRYGLFVNKTKTVFITHQINIPTGLFQGLVNFINRWFINRFDACWIPDFAGSNNLSGVLSRGTWLLKNAVYIGSLSRFKNLDNYNNLRYDILAILSGPEPQRSILEKLLLASFEKSDLKCAIVRGLPGNSGSDIHSDTVSVFQHLNDIQLQEAILSSGVIISRSGYSTVMDLYSLKKKAIFIPTPGQREQEYLAKKFYTEGVAPCCRQEDFDLNTLLSQVASFKGFTDLEMN